MTSQCPDILEATKLADCTTPSIAATCVRRSSQIADIEAFERILDEGLQIHRVELYSFQLMPNHYHLVLRPLVDGVMSRFMGWVGGTHTMRYHAGYHTSGMGHVYQQRYRSLPIQDDKHFFVVCRYVDAMPCVLDWSIERNSGDGVRCGVGWASPNPTHGCYHRGPCRDFPDEPTEPMLRFQKKSWQRFVFLPSVANRLAMKAGSSPLHVASIWNRRCVRGAANGLASPKPKTKRPDPFDLSKTTSWMTPTNCRRPRPL